MARNPKNPKTMTFSKAEVKATKTPVSLAPNVKLPYRPKSLTVQQLRRAIAAARS